MFNTNVISINILNTFIEINPALNECSLNILKYIGNIFYIVKIFSQ